MSRFINRIKQFDIKRMLRMIGVIKERSNRSFIHIILDIFRCYIKFGSGYMDYYLFYFEEIPDSIKETYITEKVNQNYLRKCNDREYYKYLDNKILFLDTYKNFIKRDYLDLNSASFEEFKDFVSKHSEFMAKPVNGFCGYGIELINAKDKNIESLYNELKEKKQFLLEERINQNKDISRIYSNSINTLRIVTLNKNNYVQVLFRCLRIGNKGKVVDNFNNSGLLAVVDQDGIIRKPALDKDNNVYNTHPMTNEKIVGFKIPQFKEVINLCKELAKVTPQVGLTGWDIAITENGVDVVEGNQLPGYDVYQSREQLDEDRIGLKPRFDRAIYPEKIDKKVFGKGHCIQKLIYIFLLALGLEYLLSLVNINLPLVSLSVILYILLDKHTDKRPFKNTLFILLGVSLVYMIVDYLILNYFDLGNINNPTFLYALKNLTLDCVLIVVTDLLKVFIIGIIYLYFLFPFIDKTVEKIHPNLGYVLTTIIGFAELFFIAILLISYFVVIELAFIG